VHSHGPENRHFSRQPAGQLHGHSDQHQIFHRRVRFFETHAHCKLAPRLLQKAVEQFHQAAFLFQRSKKFAQGLPCEMQIQPEKIRRAFHMHFGRRIAFQQSHAVERLQLAQRRIVQLALFEQAGLQRLRQKSVALTGYLEFLLEENASPKFSIITPRESTLRGAQISLRIPDKGKAFCEELATAGVIGDWREPDILRVAPVPLYNSYQDVYEFVRRFSASLRKD